MCHNSNQQGVNKVAIYTVNKGVKMFLPVSFNNVATILNQQMCQNTQPVVCKSVST